MRVRALIPVSLEQLILDHLQFAPHSGPKPTMILISSFFVTPTPGAKAFYREYLSIVLNCHLCCTIKHVIVNTFPTQERKRREEREQQEREEQEEKDKLLREEQRVEVCASILHLFNSWSNKPWFR